MLATVLRVLATLRVKVNNILRLIVEVYCGIVLIAFLFLWEGEKLEAPDAFFKSLMWPVIACEHTPECNKRIFGNNIDIES